MFASLFIDASTILPAITTTAHLRGGRITVDAKLASVPVRVAFAVSVRPAGGIRESRSRGGVRTRGDHVEVRSTITAWHR
jgi:hypothetical protein